MRCCHIIAARLSINLFDLTTKNHRPNSTSVKKRRRPNADKLSGRKKPRRKDINQEFITHHPLKPPDEDLSQEKEEEEILDYEMPVSEVR